MCIVYKIIEQLLVCVCVYIYIKVKVQFTL